MVENINLLLGATMNDVISLFSAKEKKEKEENQEGDVELFEEIVDRNLKNKERMRLERLKANKGVLTSYRIKN